MLSTNLITIQATKPTTITPSRYHRGLTRDCDC